MIKFRTLKNSYVRLKENFTHIITEKEAQERFLSKILDEAIEEFERSGRRTISLEEWREHIRRDYNIVL